VRPYRYIRYSMLLYWSWNTRIRPRHPKCLRSLYVNAITCNNPWVEVFDGKMRSDAVTRAEFCKGSVDRGHHGESLGLISSNNGLPTFAAVIRARHIAILAEYHEGGYLAEMFTVWGRISSLFPLCL